MRTMRYHNRICLVIKSIKYKKHSYFISEEKIILFGSEIRHVEFY